jgi:hypothetical protein
MPASHVAQRTLSANQGLRLVSFGNAEEMTLPQKDFRGRQKMFGDLREENLS